MGTTLGCGSAKLEECFSAPLHAMPPLLVRLAERMRAAGGLLADFRPVQPQTRVPVCAARTLNARAQSRVSLSPR